MKIITNDDYFNIPSNDIKRVYIINDRTGYAVQMIFLLRWDDKDKKLYGTSLVSTNNKEEAHTFFNMICHVIETKNEEVTIDIRRNQND